MDFKNKTVWITGASSGIGEALTYAFADAGANVILSSRKEADLKKVQANCNPKVKTWVKPLDVAEHEVLKTQIPKILSEVGSVDILVNNAGISQRGNALDTDFEVEKRIMDINFFGAILLTKLIAPKMVERQSGHVVVISSVTGKISTKQRSTYAASKHALHGYFDALRAELAAENVGVTLVCPGYIKTNISLNAVLANGQKQNKMDAGQANGIAPEVLAKKILSAVRHNENEILVGGLKEKSAVLMKRFFPNLFFRIIKNAKTT